MAADNVATGIRSLTQRAGSKTVLIPVHPYRWKTRFVLPASIILAVLAAAGWSARDVVLPATDVRVVPSVLKAVAQVPDTPNTLTNRQTGGGIIAQAAGWIESDPYAIGVSALTDGIVCEVLALEGQRVAVGDVLARLIDDDAKLAVQKAEADLAASKAELDSAQRHWENPVERRRAVATTKASLAESRAELVKLDHDIAAERSRVGELTELTTRTEKAASSQAVSARELIVFRFQLQAQEAVLRATEARRPILEAVVEQRAAEAKAAEENSALRIEEARALDAAKAAVLQTQAMLAEAKLRLFRTEVRSPAAGVVMNRLAEPGAKMVLGLDAPQSAYIARLFDPAKLQVRVDVPLADASKVGVGVRTEVTVEALPGRTLQGEVTRVVNEADLTKNTLQFKVRIIDAPDGLKPEMLARVKFLARGEASTSSTGATTSGGLHLPFVPEALIRRDGVSAFVLIADRAAGVARQRAITVGDQLQDGWVPVTSGLAAGDSIIAEPEGVRDGTRIRIVGETIASHGKAGG